MYELNRGSPPLLYKGHWVVLNNVHLMPRWLPTLDKRLDYFKEIGSNPGFRLMLSSDPSEMIPVGILERQVVEKV